ncbi:MAG: monofunctional biosynthetic peptidoglycan transglycosylase [Muribaculaceae bacterium]|nr:monofunctional biosynthetic peptidoglycan transglycosylase [Muribaculaceae bacterium]
MILKQRLKAVAVFVGLWLRNAVIFFFVSTLLAVLLWRWVPVYLTPLMLTRAVGHVMDGNLPRLHHKWVSLDEINDNAGQAVIASEDQNFLKHNGFDFKAISQAIDEAQRGKRQRGASTISQQTAKNVFLWNGHSWLRKGLEIYFTVLIEHVWGKERILEVYLNVAETGDGIYGVEAVARRHFHKAASRLTEGDAALIAATLPNPRERDSAHPTPYLLKRKRQILRQMHNLRPWRQQASTAP